MGGKQTKIEGSFLPTSPSVQENKMLDPRSPSGSRTPMHLSDNCVDTNIQLSSLETPKRDSHSDNNPLDVLRKRFLKGFTYLNDPRSPSLRLNRTPLIFEDALEKSLNLDDTFTDLFVESRQSKNLNQIKEQQQLKSEENVDIDMPEEKDKLELSLSEEANSAQRLPRTPFILQQKIDPRSPSIGVERTPIFIADYDTDEANEDSMLENILATLSLNLNSSGTSSSASMPSQNLNVSVQVSNDLEITKPRPINKHLDRVKGAKKFSNKRTHRKPKRRLSRQHIYVDSENQITTTPKLKASPVNKNDSLIGSRTPLGCVRNRNGSHARSRSVESSAKSIKTRLALTCFDDTLNPSENKNVHNLIIMQQDSNDSSQS